MSAVVAIGVDEKQSDDLKCSWSRTIKAPCSIQAGVREHLSIAQIGFDSSHLVELADEALKAETVRLLRCAMLGIVIYEKYTAVPALRAPCTRTARYGF